MPGLWGHINHLYEDHDLRFRDIKQVFRDLGSGKLETYEKFDGQNLYITWDFEEDKLKVARNKQNVKDRGLDRYGLSLKFGDRPNVEKSFIQAYDALDKALRPLAYNYKRELFGNTGGIWFSIEVLNPELPNTIYYDHKVICFHKYGPMLFSFDGEPIQTNLHRNLEVLDMLIDKINNNVDDWNICGPKLFKIKPIKESAINNACQKLDAICLAANVKENVRIRDFLYKRLIEDMQRFPIVPQQTKIGVARRLVKLIGAPTLKEIYKSLDRLLLDQTKYMVSEEKKVITKLLSPIENTIHQFSTRILNGVKSDHIDDIEKESKRIQKLFEQSCHTLRMEEESKLVDQAIPKIGDGNVTMEGLVFMYRENLYKITGAFGPMNKVISTVKYGKQKRIENPQNKPLSYYIFAG
jgi:hypothetical protein